MSFEGTRKWDLLHRPVYSSSRYRCTPWRKKVSELDCFLRRALRRGPRETTCQPVLQFKMGEKTSLVYRAAFA